MYCLLFIRNIFRKYFYPLLYLRFGSLRCKIALKPSFIIQNIQYILISFDAPTADEIVDVM